MGLYDPPNMPILIELWLIYEIQNELTSFFHSLVEVVVNHLLVEFVAESEFKSGFFHALVDGFDRIGGSREESLAKRLDAWRHNEYSAGIIAIHSLHVHSALNVNVENGVIAFLLNTSNLAL